MDFINTKFERFRKLVYLYIIFNKQIMYYCIKNLFENKIKKIIL